MLIVKPKHGKRQYKGGRGIISNILNSPLAQKLAVAAVTGAVKGLTQSALKRRQEQGEVVPRKRADQIINGRGILFE